MGRVFGTGAAEAISVLENEIKPDRTVLGIFKLKNAVQSEFI